jgi:hypothetical protein
VGRNNTQNNTKTQNTRNKKQNMQKKRKHMDGMEIILHPFLTSVLDGGDGSGSCSQPIYPREEYIPVSVE